MNRRFLPGALILCCLAVECRADDWPQFRGLRRDGISLEKGLLKTWPKEGPKLSWTFANAGLGFSSIAVVGEVAYICGTRGDDEVVMAIDAKGKEMWTARIGPIFTFQGNTWGDGPRGTPTIDGNYLYALGGQGELICIDLAAKGKEKEVWRKNLIKDLGGEMMTQWGYSESPLIDGDLLICTPGGKQGTFAALNKKTGKVQWRSRELTNTAPYSSVMAADINGVRQYIGNSYIDADKNKGGVVTGVSAKDGTILWSGSIFDGASYAISPTPIVKDNLVYVTSSGGSHLFEIGKDMKAKELYSKKAKKAVKNNHGGVVLVGDHIYGHGDPEMWICQNLKSGKTDGPEGWSERNSRISGSILAADGKLYLLSDKGEVSLVEADPTKYVEISTFTLPQLSKYPATRLTSQSSRVWSYPAISNGKLYLRDCEYVYCYEIK